MISSRWPRPMGVMESMFFRPVCTGWSTDFRAITPGATFSTTSDSLVLRGPLPSMGLPRESTTRPSSSGPTGTSSTRPVHFTFCPSARPRYSPSTTAPTESCSRFSAMPNTPPWNSIISPYITSASPLIRTISSDTPTMDPSLRASDVVSRFAIRCLSSWLISDGLSCCMVRSSNSRIQCFGQSGQLALHGSINHQVTCADDGATQNRSVDRGGDVDFPAEAFLQGSSQFAGLVGAQGKCRNDFHIDALFLLRFQLFEQHRNGRQGRQALVARQQGHKVAPALVQLVRAQLQESVCLLLGCNLGIGQQSGDAGVTGHSSGEVEHRRPLLQGTGFVSKLKRCFRVGSGNRCKFCHIRSRYSSAASCSSILPWAAWSTEAARIFSAPAMDRAATCARNISLARFTSRSISVWAECFRRSPSTRACSLASSTS